MSILAGAYGVAARAPEPQVVSWRYHFTDMRSGRYITHLPLVGAEFTEILSGVGAGQGLIPLASEEVRARNPWAATIPRKTVCWAERQVHNPETGRVAYSTFPWAGPVLSRRRSRSGRGMALGMVSWAGWFARRLIAEDLLFTQQDDFELIRILFAHVLDFPAGECAHIDPQRFTNQAGTYSDRSYSTSDLKPVLEAVQQFATAEDVEWRWRYGRDTATPELFRARLELGRPLGRFDAPDLVWSSDENTTRAGQLIDYEVLEDGSGVNNLVTAMGAGSGPAQLRATVGGFDVGRDEVGYGYPLWEGSLSSSTSDLKTQESVERHARGALLAGFASELLVSGIVVRGDLSPTLDTYELGDVATLNLADPYSPEEQIDTTARILGRKILPSEPGRNEKVTMTVQPALNLDAVA